MAKKKKTRAKRRVMGVLGKAGVMVMALPPLVGSGVDAIMRGVDVEKISVMGRFSTAFAVFINNLAEGYGFEQPYGNITVKSEVGGAVLVNTRSINIPQGVWIKTTIIGGLMLAQDRIVAFLLKRPVKIPGTNMFLTGN